MESLNNYKSNVFTYYNIYKLPINKNKIDFDNGICKKCTSIEEFEHLIRTAVHKASFGFFLTNVLYFIDNSTSEKYLVFSKESLNYLPIFDGNNYVNSDVNSVMNVYNNYLPLITAINSNKFIHYNISIDSLLYFRKDNYIKYSLQKSDKIVSFTKFLSKSPIMWSEIISPLHIIIEMMHSRLEPDLIPWMEFKEKFIKFYKIVSSADINKTNAKIYEPFRNLLEFCQYYFSMRYGAVDYTNYIISKLCIVQDNRVVKKDSTKALNYKQYVDLFAFALILHFLMPLNYNKNAEDYKIITNFITSAVAFEQF